MSDVENTVRQPAVGASAQRKLRSESSVSLPERPLPALPIAETNAQAERSSPPIPSSQTVNSPHPEMTAATRFRIALFQFSDQEAAARLKELGWQSATSDKGELLVRRNDQEKWHRFDPSSPRDWGKDAAALTGLTLQTAPIAADVVIKIAGALAAGGEVLGGATAPAAPVTILGAARAGAAVNVTGVLMVQGVGLALGERKEIDYSALAVAAVAGAVFGAAGKAAQESVRRNPALQEAIAKTTQKLRTMGSAITSSTETIRTALRNGVNSAIESGEASIDLALYRLRELGEQASTAAQHALAGGPQPALAGSARAISLPPRPAYPQRMTPSSHNNTIASHPDAVRSITVPVLENAPAQAADISDLPGQMQRFREARDRFKAVLDRDHGTIEDAHLIEQRHAPKRAGAKTTPLNLDGRSVEKLWKERFNLDLSTPNTLADLTGIDGVLDPSTAKAVSFPKLSLPQLLDKTMRRLDNLIDETSRATKQQFYIDGHERIALDNNGNKRSITDLDRQTFEASAQFLGSIRDRVLEMKNKPESLDPKAVAELLGLNPQFVTKDGAYAVQIKRGVSSAVEHLRKQSKLNHGDVNIPVIIGAPEEFTGSMQEFHGVLLKELRSLVTNGYLLGRPAAGTGHTAFNARAEEMLSAALSGR